MFMNIINKRIDYPIHFFFFFSIQPYNNAKVIPSEVKKARVNAVTSAYNNI